MAEKQGQSLRRNRIQLHDSGEATSDNGAQFSVVISNAAGSCYQQHGDFNRERPTCDHHAARQARPIAAGQTATFSVTATGTAPLSYQWKKNGATISGATASTYTTPRTTGSDNGAQFTVVVSNTAGKTTSNIATLTVKRPVAPSITVQPTSQTVTAGQTATFSVTASGTAPLSYQWRRTAQPSAAQPRRPTPRPRRPVQTMERSSPCSSVTPQAASPATLPRSP